MHWGSAELDVLRRPTATFAALARDPREGRGRLGGRVALLLAVTSTAVSLTTAGRLVPEHLAFGIASWAFVPAIQLVAAALTLRVVHRRAPLVHSLSVYAVGNAPWLLVFIAVPMLMLLAPGLAVSFWLGKGALPGAIAMAFVHGVFLTFVFHRAAMGCSRRRAAVATSLDLLAKTLLTLGWFQGMDNLAPQFFGALTR